MQVQDIDGNGFLETVSQLGIQTTSYGFLQECIVSSKVYFHMRLSHTFGAAQLPMDAE
jgi:hypothetical protein